ncbi:hypothetical protein U27_03150 [Candidatus Vecturithrix granuli]|uniref:Uncharacterized protein n=1 Tax=Vecturithrix granuli TaxID=1499967 RepID=A0A081BV33_VECG1|nr:hypothetical protein U27_03150 [Candidatus Vecturithrix granuli]
MRLESIQKDFGRRQDRDSGEHRTRECHRGTGGDTALVAETSRCERGLTNTRTSCPQDAGYAVHKELMGGYQSMAGVRETREGTGIEDRWDPYQQVDSH